MLKQAVSRHIWAVLGIGIAVIVGCTSLSGDVAPDFTLERHDGGSFTLSEQLAQGPVVLIILPPFG